MSLHILQASSANPQDCVPTASSNTRSPTSDASLQGSQAPVKGMSNQNCYHPNIYILELLEVV